MNIVFPLSGSVFHITNAPSMPIISCLLNAWEVPPLPAPRFDWEIVIHDPIVPSTCPSSRMTCVAGEVYLDFGLTPSLVIGTFVGGDATIFARTTVNGVLLEASVSIQIVGDNPDPNEVTRALGGAGAVPDLIARHESGRQQFTAGGQVLLGHAGGGDVGIMQLCGPPARCEERWNWRKNVAAGFSLFNARRNAAMQYLDQHSAGGGYPNELGVSADEVLTREAVERYHTGSVPYWMWDASAGVWRVAPTTTYVKSVLGR
jgi:hypothetical protein